ncbi:hypothetical protein BDR26DRAFT_1005163, partial [Obelidium mucronatum]
MEWTTSQDDSDPDEWEDLSQRPQEQDKQARHKMEEGRLDGGTLFPTGVFNEAPKASTGGSSWLEGLLRGETQLATLKEFVDDIMRLHCGEVGLLAGSFNVNSRPSIHQRPGSKHTEEYSTMMRILRGELVIKSLKSSVSGSLPSPISSPVNFEVKDITFETSGEHPITFGEVDGVCGDKADVESACSIDYMISLTSREKPYTSENRDEEYDSLFKERKTLEIGGIAGISVESKTKRVDKLTVDNEAYAQLSALRVGVFGNGSSLMSFINK